MRSTWTLLAIGGFFGSAVGVIGATISDPTVDFPAWVDLTGVLAGFALGVLATGTLRGRSRVTALRSRKESSITPSGGREQRPDA